MIDLNPLYTAMMALRPAILRDLMVALPGHVVSYDDGLQRAVVECGIQRHVGDGEYKTLPLIEQVPVQFAGTAEWTVFHELPEGTEGFIHFSQRAIDHWLNAGGPATPFNARMFDSSDAFFAPGYRSMKTCIAGLPQSGIGMSNKGGDIKLHLTSEGISLTAGTSELSVTPAGIAMKSGGSEVDIGEGGIGIDSPSMKHNGGNIGSDHTHGNVQNGDGRTDGPK